MANLWGAIFAGIVLNFLSLRGYFGSYDEAIFGLILALMMIFAPRGLVKYGLSILPGDRDKKADGEEQS
jgi:branched-chain amino acid transport system permease protein